MAKRVYKEHKEKNISECINEKCDTCKLSEWITDSHIHIDVNGNPICLRCPYHSYIIRGAKACKKWEKRTNE